MWKRMRHKCVAALVISGKADGALLRLARRDALRARLQAVVGGVADHVRQRILDQLQHLPIQFGLGAVHLEVDLLAEVAGEVADNTRQLVPGVADCITHLAPLPLHALHAGEP